MLYEFDGVDGGKGFLPISHDVSSRSCVNVEQPSKCDPNAKRPAAQICLEANGWRWRTKKR